MSLTLDQLLEAALDLPSVSRAEFAEKLVESLDFSENDEHKRLWAAESMRRRDEVRSGAVMPIPGEEVLAEMRRLAAE